MISLLGLAIMISDCLGLNKMEITPRQKAVCRNTFHKMSDTSNNNLNTSVVKTSTFSGCTPTVQTRSKWIHCSLFLLHTGPISKTIFPISHVHIYWQYTCCYIFLNAILCLRQMLKWQYATHENIIISASFEKSWL